MLHNPDIARRKPHPYAEIFPPMSKEAFTALKSDISRHGQQVPILLYQDQILDGRTREAACFELGIEPRYQQAEVADDAAALDLVMSLNEFRRHLTLEQSAFAAARYANAREGRLWPQKARTKLTGPRGPVNSNPDGSVTVSDAAKRFKVSPSTVKRARRILKHGDKDLEQEVVNGKKPLARASRELASKPAKPKPPKLSPYVRTNPLPKLRALTREEVDPDFQGSPLQFAQKHGHVQIMTAAEKAAAESILRCDTLFSLLRDFNARMPAETITAEGVEAWLVNYSKKAVERAMRRTVLAQNITAFEQTIARLQPLFTALRQEPVTAEVATA